MKGFAKSAKILDRGRKIKDGSYGSARKGRTGRKQVYLEKNQMEMDLQIRKTPVTMIPFTGKKMKKGRDISAKAAERKEKRGKGRRDYKIGGGIPKV